MRAEELKIGGKPDEFGPFCVYVLQMEGKREFYIGHTKHLQKRIEQHLRGETRSLRGREIIRVAHTEGFATRAEAMRRERYFLKSSRGRAKLEVLIGEREGG